MGITAQFLEVAVGELTGGGDWAAGARAGADLSQFPNRGEIDADDYLGQWGREAGRCSSFLETREN